MSLKEKIKNFLKGFKENWLWVSIGSYIGATIVGWFEFL